MPDYKLAYLLHNAPWLLHEIGLVDGPDDNSFYTLATGHSPTDIDFRPNAIFLRAIVPHNQTASFKEYLSYMFLNDINPDAGTVRNRRRVIDANMAGMTQHPSIWTESAGNPVRTQINGDEIVVPERIHIYERIPFDGEITTTEDLELVLTKVANQNVTITLPE